MRVALFWVLIISIIFVSGSLGQKPRKFKKANSEDKKFWNLQAKIERLKLEEDALEAELEEELEEEIDDSLVGEIIDFPSLTQEHNQNNDEEETMEDPCQEIFCGAGRECVISEKAEGLCRCVERCENIDDDRRKVCSNHNETWPSDCELYRMRCICSEGQEECRNDKYEHVHIDYYGTCQDVAVCDEAEMSDFPRRMREWLFNIMKDLANRKELSDEVMKIEKKAEEESDPKRWANAAVWKWCELDGYPKDRAVSRHELFPLRAPLYTLEHCIAPFLDSCDPDDDHYITLKEWSNCLELTEDLTEDMEDFCEKLRE